MLTDADGALPTGFEALAPFTARWALEDAAQRTAARGDAPEGERKAFYAAARALVEPGLDYLDGKGLAAFDAADERLMNLLLSFAHVALAEEIQGDAESAHAALRAHMRITRAPAGF